MTSNSLERHILSIVCSVFDAYSVVLFLPEEEGEAHRLTAFFSLGDKIAANATVLPGKGLVGWIVRNRQPLLVPNFDQRQSNLGYYASGEEGSIKAFMGCPVPTGGALCVDSKRQYSFSDKDHKILQMFAELIARQQGSRGRQELAGDIPRYFADLGVIQDLRFRYKRWPQFLHNYLRIMVEATGFDYCAFASVDQPGETYCVESKSARLLLTGEEPLILPMGSGITGWVFRNDQPVVAEGVETLEHARFLLNSGCNCAQGYYYSRPVDTPEFEVLSFVQQKAFWVDPSLEKDARRLGLPLSEERPYREY